MGSLFVTCFAKQLLCCYSTMSFRVSPYLTKKWNPLQFYLRQLSLSVPSNLKIKKSSIGGTVQDIENDDQDEEQYQQLVHRAQLLLTGGHQVLVVQPFVKWGPKRNRLTTPDLMLEEAVALVSCIPNWVCVDSIKAPLLTLEKRQLFGTGSLENLVQQVQSNPHISAIFISTNLLRGSQRRELTSIFGVPIFDRYSVVLQIFKERARTHEAKLQVALAEIPYLKSTLRNSQIVARYGLAKTGPDGTSYNGSGETYFEMQSQLLLRREKKLRSEIERLEKKRSILKLHRSRREVPSVAILGYTNSGKTTLIKAITGEAKLEPRDALFATLDVTTHACKLPSNLTTLFVDTVGFICDIPTHLVAAFNATLRDAIDADILVHLIDVSHPDWQHQADTVATTLKSLDVNNSYVLLNVANKIDKLSKDELVDVSSQLPKGTLFLSALTGRGLNDFLSQIEDELIRITARLKLCFRVPNGCDEYQWLHKNTAVTCCQPVDDENNHTLVHAVISKATFGKFKSLYPNIPVGSIKSK